MAVDTGGSGAENSQGGVRMNMIPRDGGNTFRGYFSPLRGRASMQGDNFSEELKDSGLGTPDAIKRLWDFNPAFGGRSSETRSGSIDDAPDGAENYVSLFYNKNAGNPNVWTYEARHQPPPPINDHKIRNANVRVTWQATTRHKFGNQCTTPRHLRLPERPDRDGRAGSER